MGLTPVEGLIMGTRTGDMDLGVLTFIMEKEELNLQVANTLINKHSGMLGITGVSSDMREIEKAAAAGNERAILGLKMVPVPDKEIYRCLCSSHGRSRSAYFYRWNRGE